MEHSKDTQNLVSQKFTGTNKFKDGDQVFLTDPQK
eukprot:gene39682-49032_t